MSPCGHKAQATGWWAHAAGRARQIRRHSDARTFTSQTTDAHADLERYTELGADQKILAEQLDLTLPPQKPPRDHGFPQIAHSPAPLCSEDLLEAPIDFMGSLSRSRAAS